MIRLQLTECCVIWELMILLLAGPEASLTLFYGEYANEEHFSELVALYPLKRTPRTCYKVLSKYVNK